MKFQESFLLEVTLSQDLKYLQVSVSVLQREAHGWEAGNEQSCIRIQTPLKLAEILLQFVESECPTLVEAL